MSVQPKRDEEGTSRGIPFGGGVRPDTDSAQLSKRDRCTLS